MKNLPMTENALMVRTDFSDDAAWTALCEAAQRPNEDEFQAIIDCFSDPAFQGQTVEALVSAAPKNAHTFMFIADTTALTNPDHPVLVVDLYTKPGRTFRVIPSEMWDVENNLSIANTDFEDFANSTDPDGVFRGYEG